MPAQRTTSDKGVVVALEIAANKAAIAVVNRRGAIRQRLYAKTLWGRPALATLEPYLRAIESALAYSKGEGLRVRGLSVTVPGSVNALARRPLLVPVLPSLNDFPLCELLEARYDLPTALHVDVDAALLGEYHYGAGRGFRRLLFLTLNAVVGVAMAVDGQLLQAPPEYVGHISHVPVSTNGPRCSCGRRGCINTLVSTDAMLRMVRRALMRGEQTSLLERLSQRETFSPQLLAEEARRGDPIALSIYSEVGRWLGAATARYIHLFEPNILILGGGVLSASELLLAKVKSTLASQVSPDHDSILNIVPAQLGSDAVLIGAAAAHFQPALLS